MFEDSTFESTGRIRTRSRRWMIATFTLNGSILLALVLIPLIYPEALPSHALTFLLVAPAAPTQPPPPQTTVRQFHGTPEAAGSIIFAPPKIPIGITMVQDAGPAPDNGVIAMGPGTGIPGGDASPFASHRAAPAVRLQNKGAVHVSSMVVEGLLIEKRLPAYPPIARETRTEGTVVLQATISKSGTIENLRVISGPAMLQQAALDAVKTWRYRPYLLDGVPVEVETAVNVEFKLQQ
jgi:periplasmic protein TonB